MTKRTHCLLYNDSVSVNEIKPVQTVDQLIEVVNDNLPDHSSIRNLVAKAVRLNWMIEDLKHHTLLKPLLVHEHDDRFVTVLGDTRMQALEFNPHIKKVSCLLSVPIDRLDQYQDWIYINDQHHLANVLAMSVDDVIVEQDWHHEILDWIELALPESEHHMHDEHARYRAFVEQYNNNFTLTREWLATPKNWEC